MFWVFYYPCRDQKSSQDSKTRLIRTSGDISPAPTRKRAILGSEVRFTFKFRDKRSLNGNQLFGPHKDSKTNVCVCECDYM